jgi:hypothetical protein
LNTLNKTSQQYIEGLIRTDIFNSEHQKLTLPADGLQQAWSRLQTHGDIFLRCVDPSGCLMMAFAAHLYQYNSELDELTRQKLMSPLLTNYDKNFVIQQWLQEHPVSCLEAFLQAATGNEQQHVVNLLLGNTAPENDQPLSEKMVNRLTRIIPVLADILDFDTLHGQLIKKEVLSWTQYETLMAERVKYDRSVQLIDTLQHGSLHSLLRTMEALKDANMKCFGRYIPMGEMVTVHVDLDNANVSDIEDRIVAQLTKYIHNTLGDKETAVKLDLALGDLHLAAVRRVNSLMLYFYCDSTSEMFTLSQELETGHLKVIIEEVFSVLTGTSTGQNIAVRLHSQLQFIDTYNQLLLDD